jgi:HlyD family secretion protein
MRIRNLVFVFFIGLVGGGGFWIKEHYFKEEFFYSGTLEATRIVVPARIPSQIVSFPIKEGDRLKKGDTIATLDDSEIKIQLKDVSSKYNRAISLYKNARVTKNEVETLEAKKDDLELKLQWSQIRATSDGIVLSKFKEEGEWVTQGMGVISMADLRKIWAFFYVEHDKIASLSLGMQVECTLPEMPGQIFRGTILKINSEPEFTPKNVQTRKERTRLVYGIKVQFDNDDEVLKPGMSLETQFGHVFSEETDGGRLEKRHP